MWHRFKKQLIIAALLLIWYACAQRVPITGGPKDVAPPELKNSQPEMLATNFNAEKIKLEFDEYVQLKNVRKNLLITPLLRYDPEVVAVGKKVLIKDLDDSLWSNTTYVIEFNEAIQDITENNPAKGFRYVFSTGSYVDSLSLSGQIINAFTLKPIADAFAFLYQETGDSVPYNDSPRYIGRSDQNGDFKISNMKPGLYKAFFSTDENGNRLYDPSIELIDFVDGLVQVSEVSSPILKAQVFKENNEEQYVKGFGSVNDWSFYISYNLPIDTLIVKSRWKTDESIDQFRRAYNVNKDSVVFWAPDSSVKLDSIFILAETNSSPWDTLTMAIFKQDRIDKLRKKDNLSGGKLNLGQQLNFQFNYPLILLDSSKIKLYVDSTEIPIDLRLFNVSKQVEIDAKWEENRKYTLIMDSACFVNMYGQANDSNVLKFSTYPRNHYGTLEIKLDFEEGEPGFLQILDPSDKLVEEVYLTGIHKHFFEFVHPGEYKLKFLLDENRNHHWDVGNYMGGTHAEKVFIYTGTLKVRSNWDQVIEWKFK